MKKALTILIITLVWSADIFCQIDIFKFDDYHWKSKNLFYSFSDMTDSTENNPEAHALMHKANSYNTVSKISFIVGTGVAVASLIFIKPKTPEFDPNDMSTAFPNLTFSDLTPLFVGIGVFCSGFIFRGVAVDKLKKAIEANGNSARAQLLIKPEGVGLVIRF